MQCRVIQDTNSIWSTDGILTGITDPGQSRPGNNGNEGVLYVPQSSRIIGAMEGK